jgi:hypothetical protein
MFHSSRKFDLSFRKFYTDPQTLEDSIIDVSESASKGTSSIFLNVFVVEEFKLTQKFSLAATAGYHGIPSKDITVTTTSLTGKYKPEFAGPYFRIGLKMDI